ncbi:MAG: OmpA family protein [Alphaproteobacteria bacterium]|nr:OmpA family protein [Alphaproteobacteria bacterium]
MRAVVLIIALLALGAVALYAVQIFPARIEADLKQRSEEALHAANLNFAKVSVSGRVVTLSGEAPGSISKEDAVRIAGDVWGVASVRDTLLVATTGLPPAPQPVTGSSQELSENTASEPAAPAEESSSSDTLPTVGSLVDPALDSPAEEPAAPSSSDEQPSTAEAVTPAPAETASSEPAPTPTPTPAQTEAAPSEPAPQVTAQAEPPSKPSAPPSAAAPPGASVGPLPKEAIAQGITAGLTSALQAIPPAIEAAPPAYRLEARVSGRQIELQGLVSTPSAQRALVAHVRRRIRRAHIVDSMQVAHAKPDKDWLGVARSGLAQLARLDNGSLKLEGHTVSVSGKPKSESDRKRILAALSKLPRGYKSTVLLERMQDAVPAAPSIAEAAPAPEPVRPAPAPPAVPSKPRRTPPKHVAAKYRIAPAPLPVERRLSSSCRRRFNNVLPRVAVAFESGSSHIQSSVGLDDFARIARQCPGAHIRLSGHSDTQEVAPTATGLSLHRAFAVMDALEDRGVSDENITVVGRGGLRPAFSNATAEGRENNRRVEFAVW